MILWRVTQPNGARLTLRRYIFERYFLSVASPVDASLLYAIAYVLFWLAIITILYRRRIFIKI
jgi:predicted acyltransferase